MKFAPPASPRLPHLLALGVVSAVILALQVVYTRMLAIASWHHFAYLVISTALLGFGISGTILAFFREALLRRFKESAMWLTVLLALSISITPAVSQMLPVDIRYLMYSFRQAGYLMVYHILLLLPFLAGALLIGLTLIRYGANASGVYAVNLTGSGIGAGAVVFALNGIAPHTLLSAFSLLTLLLAPLWWFGESKQARGIPKAKHWIGPATAAAAAIAAALTLPTPPMDPYKMLASLERWEAQGDARRVATRFTPRARLDLTASDRLHQTLFAGLTATAPPPRQYALTADGHHADPVFRIRNARDAEILQHTPQSLPHRAVDHANVLLLDEEGGTNVWLARLYRAATITVVQPNAAMIGLVRALSDSDGGRVYRGDDVEPVIDDPRRYLEQTKTRYDIIRISSVEGAAAGVSGMLTMHETPLLTVESFSLCLRRLNEDGMLVLTRGLQTPPRDNPKLLLTAAEALEAEGVDRPETRILQAHNYLAAVTIVFRSPPDNGTVAVLAQSVRELGLTVDHAPPELLQAMSSETPQPSAADSTSLAWFARQLLGSNREALLNRYGYDLRPARDARPYFFHFFRWSSLPDFFETYGRQWLQRLEIGYLIAVSVLLETTVAGAVFILAPILYQRRRRRHEATPSAGDGRITGGVVFYFGALGVGFMFLEMVTLQRLSLLFGDPVYATAFTLAVFLVLAGVGSSTVGQRSRRAEQHGRANRFPGVFDAAWPAVSAAVAFGVLAWVDPFLTRLPAAGKVTAAFLVLAPTAVLMGRPFPRAVAVLHRHAPTQLPLAWAVNGFASVAAAPLATLVAVDGGYFPVVLFAGGMYGIACLVAIKAGTALAATES
ncbi:hypothetical protein GF324_03420 [bacterium]|nr:hypothetical protein [bacterium]